MGDASVVALDQSAWRSRRANWSHHGPSGSGKSTLMNILGCLSTPTSGEYCLDGQDVSGLKQGELAAIRQHQIGYIFPVVHLLARTTALRNVRTAAGV